MSTGAESQELLSIDANQATRSISDARSCVMLVGPGVSRDLGLGSALDEPTIKAANEQVPVLDASGSGIFGVISSYCGRLLAVPSSPVRDMIADLVATQRIAHIYTDDAHVSVLYPASASSEQIADIESRTVCIHGRISQYVCKACTAKSQLTQAVLFKAMNDKPMSCGVCGTQGRLATSSDSADATFVPDVLCGQANERMSLEMAQADAAAPIDLLLVLGASDSVTETWSAVASVLSLSATQTLVIGIMDRVPAGLVDGGKTKVVCEREDIFAQRFLARSSSSENEDLEDNDEHSDILAAVSEISLAEASSAAESSDDRLPRSSHAAFNAEDASSQQRGYRRTKPRNREKTNLAHLLNFSLPERTPLPLLRPRRRVAEGAVSERQAEVNRSLFINANFRFVLKPSFWQSFMAVSTRPDMQLRPEWIERVIMPLSGEATNCPICLSPPVAARVTRCGHVFCLPCILRHIAYSSDDKRQDRKCPICWCTISSDNLLPVHFWAAQYIAGKPATSNAQAHLGASKLAPGTHITMQLMKLGSADGGSSSSAFDSSHFPWSFSDRALTFARCMLATHGYVAGEYERELVELQQAKEDKDADSESKLFIESAVMSVEAALADAQRPSKADVRREELAFAEQAVSNALGSLQQGDTSDSSKVADDEFLYFYQADDGQHIYMHPLHMRILAHDRGGYVDMPDTLEIKLKHSVESMVTDEVRQRFRFLDHLSLRCELVIIEPELKNLVAQKSLDKFRQQLSHHEKQHAARERTMAMEEARAEMLAAAAARSAYSGYEGMQRYNIVADPDPIGAEPDSSSFPALDGAAAATISTADTDMDMSGGPEVPHLRKADGLWPREPVPNRSLSSGAYNALWEEFEQAAASSRSPGHSYDLDFETDYNGHDLDDYSIPLKVRDPQPGSKNGSAKGRKGKNKGVKLVLSGSSARRSR
ncbi:hypothetical protein IWW50_000340 [Coemansia erecta]|nr:hypothetical protein IWW50_000340 [Coemansia erecta]